MTYHNEDTLPDLRVTIAESMEALAHAQMRRARGADAADLHGEGTRWNRAMRGAQTLRWCAQREAPSYEEMKTGLAAAEEARESAEDNVRDLVDNIKYAVSKWLHSEDCAATIVDGNLDCDCGMTEHRQSILDAVA